MAGGGSVTLLPGSAVSPAAPAARVPNPGWADPDPDPSIALGAL